MSPLKQTTLWKFKPELDYMTPAEKSAFNELNSAGALSFFRLGQCERCGADVPKNKKFCSIECTDEGEEEDGKDIRPLDR